MNFILNSDIIDFIQKKFEECFMSIKIALLGFGTVASGVPFLLKENGEKIAQAAHAFWWFFNSASYSSCTRSESRAEGLGSARQPCAVRRTMMSGMI